ncbi:MAG: CHAT domain-containing protein [Bacteroidia bacterium]|nr:CHAT domain-containing protein [Bacteroidia bacterium]
MMHLAAAAAMFLFVLLPSRLSAQDPRTGCIADPGSHFRSARDSVACLEAFERLDMLSARLAAAPTPGHIAEYRAAADSVLTFTAHALEDTSHPLYIEALACVSEALWMTDREQSTAILERAVAALRTLPVPCRSAWAGRLFGNLAYQLYESGLYEKAELLYHESIAVLTGLEQPPAALTASQYLFLGLLQRRALKPEKAAEAFSESAAWQLAARDTASSAEALGWYADALYRSHDFDGAERAYLRAYSMLRQILGGQSERTLAAMQDLATYYMFVARFDDAHRILRDILSAVTRPGASYDAILVFYTYISLAGACAELGSDAEAESYFHEAARSAERIPDADRPMYQAMVTNNTASFLANRERYDEAATLVEKAMELMDVSGWADVEHFKARAASNLASMYSELGRYAEAESLLVFAVEMYGRAFGENSGELAAPLSNLGMVYRDLGRYEDAYAHIVRALTLSEQFSGPGHPLHARLLRNLASVELAMRRDSAAIVHLRQAEAELRRWYDPWHIEMLDCFQIMGRWCERHPDDADAPDVMRLLAEGTTRRLRDSFDFESEQRQLQLYERFAAKNLGIIARWARSTTNPSAAEILFTALMHLKGEILAEQTRIHRGVRGRQQEADLAQRLYDTRERYAALATKPPAEAILALRQRLLREIDSLDAALRSFSAGYMRQRRLNDAGWREVQRALRRDEAMIIYLFTPAGESDSTRGLVAIVLRADSPPLLVPLCSEGELQRALVTPLDAKVLSLLPEDEKMLKLGALIWDPLAGSLRNIRRCVIIPDGVLHRVAFAALVSSASGEPAVLDAVLELRQHVSLKGLLTRHPSSIPERDPTASRCVLIGNPEFGTSASGQSTRLHSIWAPLPGTKRELHRIAGICRENGVETRIAEGDEASEHTVKSLSSTDVRILHIATHGFFFPAPSDEATASTTLMENTRGRESFRIERHPLLRSGLILARANAAWSGGPVGEKDEDGILTALEISRLDFGGTELVTLSACETALGDITTGDGVFGLQRSFFIAGASSLLMSLWKVPDQPTAELMSAFYAAWFSGMSTSEALRTARSELRIKYPDPRIWAPFVLVGE